MTATAHAVVGGAIAARIPNPFIAFPIAIASHVLLDLVPHWDVGVNWRNKPRLRFFLEATADVSIGILSVTVFFLPRTDPVYLYSTMIVAQLPDWIEVPYLFLRWDVPPFSTIYALGSRLQTRAAILPGIATQIATIALAVWWGIS